MRVLIDYRPALRERSGAGEYTHQLAKALLEAYPPGAAGAALELTIFSSSWRDRLTPCVELSGAGAIDRRIPVRLLNLLWHRAGWPAIETLAASRYDVVHSSHPLLMPSRAAAQVITIHDLNFLSHPERTRAEIRRDYPALVRGHALRADAIIVPSAFTAGEVERRLGVPPERIAVCPHGAPDWTPRATPPNDGYVLFFSTLEPRKNVGGLLDAYEQLLVGQASPTGPAGPAKAGHYGQHDNGQHDNGPRDNGPRDNGPRDNGQRDNAAHDQSAHRDESHLAPGFGDQRRGVSGFSDQSRGVSGFSDQSRGVSGFSDQSHRVSGFSDQSHRVSGFSDQSHRVSGFSAQSHVVSGFSRTVPELVLAGKATDDAREWLARIERPPLKGFVRHIGYVDPANRRALFEGARLLVMPSFEEGFGIPVLEAMSAGVPVVAANRGSLPEVLGDAGPLVDPDRPAEIAAAIHRLLTDDSYAASCIGRGVARAKEFRWDRTAHRVYAAYEQAIARRRQRSRAA